MTPTRFLPPCRIALSALAVVLSAATWAVAQCGNCDSGNCQGRCLYCVDGECTPNRTTYGFYQTHWRRWPVDAPAVPERPRAGRPPLGDVLGPGEIDLPATEEEADVRPEFSRLRETGDPTRGGTREDAPPKPEAGVLPQDDTNSQTPDMFDLNNGLPGLEIPAAEEDSLPLNTGASNGRPLSAEEDSLPLNQGASNKRPLRPLPPVRQATANKDLTTGIRNPLRGNIAGRPNVVPSSVVQPTSHARPRHPKRLRPGSGRGGNPFR